MCTKFRPWPALGPMVLIAVLCPPDVLGDFEPPPPPPPQRRKAGESVPPLPLPATPLRRSEKKREPAPPALVGKVRYGQPIWKTTEDGRRFSYLDWQSDVSDAHYLLELANGLLGVRYRDVQIDLGSFSYTPSEVPVLYFTGHENFSFAPEQREKLRSYLQDGGFLWGDACCGSRKFVLAFHEEMKQIFPQRPLKAVPLDHPLFDCFYDIRKVSVQEEAQPAVEKEPEMDMVSLGCRAAVLLSRWDLSCGWARHAHPQGRKVVPEQANQLGVNMVSYVLSHYQLGRFLSNPVVYAEESEPTRENLVFGQIVHGGDWDPSPSAIMNLLKYVGRNSTLEVQFKRAPVDLRQVDAFRFPFLYLTGHDDFGFTDAEAACLRSFLKTGGTLIADACCGRKAFDQAFRREMRRVLPGQGLQPLPLTHPLMTAAADIRQVHYTDFVQQNQPDHHAPDLEGVEWNGVLAVIYSRYAFGSAWDGFERPYARGYKAEDALRIGLNAMVYAMSH
ncbi:MAG: DUF4159 domain-containing protein [Planctomycetes bacterium]|nr:DUF4159 domain-containing protein [Planctomycetota bacterium]